MGQGDPHGQHQAGVSGFPDAVQREAVHRQSGIVLNSEFVTIPGLQPTTSCCAEPGKPWPACQKRANLPSSCSRNLPAFRQLTAAFDARGGQHSHRSIVCWSTAGRIAGRLRASRRCHGRRPDVRSTTPELCDADQYRSLAHSHRLVHAGARRLHHDAAPETHRSRLSVLASTVRSSAANRRLFRLFADRPSMLSSIAVQESVWLYGQVSGGSRSRLTLAVLSAADLRGESQTWPPGPTGRSVTSD